MTEAEGLKQVLNLSVYGPLGVLALLGIIVSIKFYMDNRTDRKESAAAILALHATYQARIDALQKEHDDDRKEWQGELKVLVERYTIKADNNIDKYHALVEGLNRVLGSVGRRNPRQRDPANGGQEDT